MSQPNVTKTYASGNAKSETFRKRRGTTNKGTDYENLNVADFVVKLVTNQQVSNFTLSSNDERFGAFDDIVIKVESKKTAEVIAIQLKHNDRGNLKLEQLRGKKDDFSIIKYCDSVQEISERCDKYVLYTNLTFDITKKTSEFELESLEFKVGVKEILLDDTLKIFSKVEHAYQFFIVEGSYGSDKSSNVEKYQQFFQKFYLYANQDNVNNVKKSLLEAFSKSFNATEQVAESYIKFITEWSKIEGRKHKLDKNWMTHVLVLQLLSSKMKPLCFNLENEKTLALEKAFSLFNVVPLNEKMFEKLKEMWGVVKNSLNNRKEISTIASKYQLSLDDSNSTTLNQIFWLQGRCPLVVEADDAVYKAIELCPEKNYIFLCGEIEIKKLSKQVKIFHNLSDIQDHPEIYNELTAIFKCSVQGKADVSLQKLCNEYKKLPSLIQSDDLVEMLNNPLKIGGPKESFSFPYVNRYLFRHIIDSEYLEKTDEETVILIDNVANINSLKSRFKRQNFVKIESKDDDDSESENSDLKSVIYVSETTRSFSEFENLSQKNIKVQTCHHFRLLNDENLEWIRSKGDINQLQNYKLLTNRLKEETFWSQKPENNINYIVGEPGMGKSELMKSLKNQTPSEIWTIVILPEDIFSFFQKTEATATAFFEFITREKSKNFGSRDQELLKLFAEKGNVVYVWDALDEIETAKVGTVGDLILKFSEKSWAQWITSRTHLQKSLELKFNVLSRNLTRFDREEQQMYIRDRLITTTSFETIAAFNEQIQTSVALVEKNNILGVPLLLFMMTELIKNNNEVDLFRGGFSLSNLYQYFVEEKFKVYYKVKLGVNYETNFNVKQQYEALKEQTLQRHVKAALKLLLPSKVVKRFEVDTETIKITETDILIGLIVGNQNNVAIFTHISFAEYLVATYLLENCDKKHCLKEILFEEKYSNIRFFFDLILAKDSPPHIAVLYKNLELIKKYECDIPTCKDNGGRCVLHLICSWGQRHPHFNVKKSFDKYIIDHNYRFTISGETQEYSELLNFLLDKCNSTETDDLFKMTPLDYAQESLSLVAEIKLRRKQNAISNLNVNYVSNIFYYSARFGYLEAFELLIHNYKHLINMRNIYNCTLIIIAIDCKHLNVVKLLLLVGADINVAINNGATPLYLACANGITDVAKELLRCGANVNQATSKGFTPLYVASQREHFETVNLLLDHGANINKASKAGSTPLYATSLKGSKKIVNVLLHRGANVNQVGFYGSTPLYVACQNGHLDTVTMLLNHDANINHGAKDGSMPLGIASSRGHKDIVNVLLARNAAVNQTANNGSTPLYVACQNGHRDTVNMLLDHNANINQTSKVGFTPLCAACSKGHGEIINVLLERGARINQADNRGFTPLYLACQNGHLDAVNTLLDHEANINQATKAGSTPLKIARSKGHNEIVKVLIDRGAVTLNTDKKCVLM